MVTEPSRWISSVTRWRRRRARRGGCACRGRGGRCGRARAARRAHRRLGVGRAAGGRRLGRRSSSASAAGVERLRARGALAAAGAAGAGSASGSPRSSRARRASRSRLGPWRRRVGSSTTPPPTVSGGASERITSGPRAAGDERLLEPQLEVAAAELGEPRRRLARAVVDGDARAAVGRGVGRGPVERDVDAEAGGRRRGPAHDHVAARHLVAPHAGQVQRHALAGLGALARLVVDLHGADARGGARGQDADLVAAAAGPPTASP